MNSVGALLLGGEESRRIRVLSGVLSAVEALSGVLSAGREEVEPMAGHQDRHGLTDP